LKQNGQKIFHLLVMFIKININSQIRILTYKKIWNKKLILNIILEDMIVSSIDIYLYSYT